MPACTHCQANLSTPRYLQRHLKTSKRCLALREKRALEDKVKMLESYPPQGSNTTIYNIQNNIQNNYYIDLDYLSNIVRGLEYNDLRDMDKLLEELHAWGWKDGAITCSDPSRYVLKFDKPDGTTVRDYKSLEFLRNIFIEETSDGKDFSLTIRNGEQAHQEDLHNKKLISLDDYLKNLGDVSRWRSNWQKASKQEGPFFKKLRQKLCELVMNTTVCGKTKITL